MRLTLRLTFNTPLPANYGTADNEEFVSPDAWTIDTGAGSFTNAETSSLQVFMASTDASGNIVAWSILITSTKGASVTSVHVPYQYSEDTVSLTDVNGNPLGAALNSGASGTWSIGQSASAPPVLVGAAGGLAVPGGLATLYGIFPGVEQQATTGLPWPTMLGGISISIGGYAAPLAYVSSTQINLQIPWELTGQSSAMVTVGGQASFTAALAPVAPEIFQGAIVNATFRVVDQGNPVSAGNVIQIYCTGLGAVDVVQPDGNYAPPVYAVVHTLSTPTVSIGGATAPIMFSGLAPGFVGLYQINVMVPSGAARGDAVPLTISINGVSSDPVRIPVD